MNDWEWNIGPILGILLGIPDAENIYLLVAPLNQRVAIIQPF